MFVSSTISAEKMSKIHFMSGITNLLILTILDKSDSYMYKIVKYISYFSYEKLYIRSVLPAKNIR